MKNDVLKLVAPRPHFAQTMSDAEGRQMQEHGKYWAELMPTGIVVALGLVADPNGFYGLGIVQVADEVDPGSIADSDPAIKANVGMRYEICPMPHLITRG